MVKIEFHFLHNLSFSDCLRDFKYCLKFEFKSFTIEHTLSQRLNLLYILFYYMKRLNILDLVA